MIRVAVSAVLLAAATTSGAAGCEVTPAAPSPDAVKSDGSDGAVVVGTSFSRNSVREAHYAECETPAGERFMVEVTAEVEYQLQEGQPCPEGPREPMASDRYPEIAEELQRRLPYGGGDKGTCGEWETINKEEARRMAAECPPLKWGDVS